MPFSAAYFIPNERLAELKHPPQRYQPLTADGKGDLRLANTGYVLLGTAEDSLLVLITQFLKFMHKLIMPKNYVGMLISLLLVILTGPFEMSNTAGRLVVDVVTGLVMLSCTLAISPKRGHSVLAISLACLTTFLWINVSLFDFFPFNSLYFKGFTYLCGFAFVVTTICFIVRDVFSNKVTHNRICGAICVYLLVGFSFALIYTLVFAVNAGSFKCMEVDDMAGHKLASRFAMFSYYSFCTMSTLGLGDITPRSNFTRSLSWLEAVIGQMYLTVLVARLVGLQIAEKERAIHRRDHQT